MDVQQASRAARHLKAVSDPNRIRILSILVEGEFCVTDLVERLAIDQPKVSHHLAILRSAGIIRCRRDGRHVNYSLVPQIHRRVTEGAGARDVFDLGVLEVAFRFHEAGAAGTTAPQPEQIGAPTPAMSGRYAADAAAD
jgi:ArsR family transcriptional regulator